MPQEPALTQWQFPPASDADEHGVVGVGADLEPGTLLAAYRQGVFPMPIPGRYQIAWWSPDPRGIIPVDGFHCSRSLARVVDRFEIRIDTAFVEVMRACADPRRPHGWIDESFIAAYTRLHELGWAHSVETWTPDGHLVGGLYGVAIGGLFAGESMFHTERDASKVALVGLVELLVQRGGTLLDVQWTTEHLASLGAIDLPRVEYLERLEKAVALDVDQFAPP